MKFKPDQTYEGLLTQANALARIVNAQEVQIAHCQAASLHELAKLKGRIESEREMNAILTAENEALRARLAFYELPKKT